MTTFIKRDAGLVVRDIGDELLLLDLSSNRVHQLNRTASFVWRHCGDRTSVEEIRRSVLAAFDIAEEVVDKDVRSILQTLERLGLVARVDPREEKTAA